MILKISPPRKLRVSSLENDLVSTGVSYSTGSMYVGEVVVEQSVLYTDTTTPYIGKHFDCGKEHKCKNKKSGSRAVINKRRTY